MLLHKIVSTSIAPTSIGVEMLSPDSPRPIHMSLDAIIETSLRDLARSLISPDGIESFVGSTPESFVTRNDLKKIPEVFSSIVVTHLVGSHPLLENAVSYVSSTLIGGSISPTEHCWNFFLDPKLKNKFPNDMDCTGLAIPLVLDVLSRQQLRKLGKLMLSNVTKDAIDKPISEDTLNVFQVYFPENRVAFKRSNRVDPCVCVNSIYGILHLWQREHIDTEEIREAKGISGSLPYILAHLDMGSQSRFQKITRYYPYPEEFLFFLSRLVSKFSDILDQLCPNFSQKAVQGIEKALKSNLGQDLDTILPSALRVLVTKELKLPLNLDLEKKHLLGQIQQHKGNLPPEVFFGCGQAQLLFGASGVTTAFALAALDFQADQFYFSALRESLALDFEYTKNQHATLAEALAPESSRNNSDLLKISAGFLDFALSYQIQNEQEFREITQAIADWRLHKRSSISGEDIEPSELKLLAPLGFIENLEETLDLSEKRNIKNTFVRRFGLSLQDLTEEIPKTSSCGGERTAEFYTKLLGAHFDLWTVLNFERYPTDSSVERTLEVSNLCKLLGEILFIQNSLVLFASNTFGPSNSILTEGKNTHLSIQQIVTHAQEHYQTLKKEFLTKLDTIAKRVEEIADDNSDSLKGANEIVAFFRHLPDAHGAFLASSFLKEV